MRGGIDYDFIGVVSRDPTADLGLPRLGTFEDMRAVLAEHPADELIVTDSDYSERELLQIVEDAHRSGVKVRDRAEDDGAARPARGVRAGPGLPLFELRPPVFAGTDWAIKRTFDLAVSPLVIVAGLPLWLAIAAVIKLTSRGPGLLPRPAHRARRADVRDVQVPDDGRAARPSSRPSSAS